MADSQEIGKKTDEIISLLKAENVNEKGKSEKLGQVEKLFEIVQGSQQQLNMLDHKVQNLVKLADEKAQGSNIMGNLLEAAEACQTVSEKLASFTADTDKLKVDLQNQQKQNMKDVMLENADFRDKCYRMASDNLQVVGNNFHLFSELVAQVADEFRGTKHYLQNVLSNIVNVGPQHSAPRSIHIPVYTNVAPAGDSESNANQLPQVGETDSVVNFNSATADDMEQRSRFVQQALDNFDQQNTENLVTYIIGPQTTQQQNGEGDAQSTASSSRNLQTYTEEREQESLQVNVVSPQTPMESESVGKDEDVVRQESSKEKGKQNHYDEIIEMIASAPKKKRCASGKMQAPSKKLKVSSIEGQKVGAVQINAHLLEQRKRGKDDDIGGTPEHFDPIYAQKPRVLPFRREPDGDDHQNGVSPYCVFSKEEYSLVRGTPVLSHADVSHFVKLVVPDVFQSDLLVPENKKDEFMANEGSFCIPYTEEPLNYLSPAIFFSQERVAEISQICKPEQKPLYRGRSSDSTTTKQQMQAMEDRNFFLELLASKMNDMENEQSFYFSIDSGDVLPVVAVLTSFDVESVCQ